MSRTMLSIALIILLLIISQGCKDESNPLIPPSEHFDPEGWIITNDSTNAAVIIWQGNIVNEWGVITAEDTFFAVKDSISDHYSIRFISRDSTIINPPDEADHTFGFNIADNNIAALLPDEAGGWGFHLQGKLIGNTSVELQVLHTGHVDIRTPYIPIRVTGQQ